MNDLFQRQSVYSKCMLIASSDGLYSNTTILTDTISSYQRTIESPQAVCSK